MSSGTVRQPRGATRMQARASSVAASLLVTTVGVAVGLAAARSPELVLGGTVVLVAAGSFGMLVRHLDVAPRTPLDAALWSAVVLLPLAPFLTTLSPQLTVVRLLPAGLVVLGIVLRTVRSVSSWGGLQWAALLFAAYQSVPLVLAPSGYGLTRWINWVVFVPFAFVHFDPRAMRIALAATGTTGALLVVGVLLQSVGVLGGLWGGAVLQGAGTVEEVRITRYTSFLLNPNDLALFALGAAVVLMVALRHAGRGTRSVLVLLTLALLAVTLLTASRGALLAGLVILGWMAGRARLRQAVGVVLASSIAIVLLVLLVPSAQTSAASTASSLSAILTGEDVSADDRLELWRQRLDEGRGNPLTGAGYGGYAQVEVVATADIADAAARAELYQALTVDNGWLRLYLESGLLGVALLAAVVLGSVWTSVLASRQGTSGVWPDALAALLLALTSRGFSADVFDINPWNFFLWLLVGLISSLHAAQRVAR